MDPVLRHLQSRRPAGEYQFLAHLVGALSDEAELRSFDIVVDQPPVSTSIPSPHPAADPDRAARLKIEYRTAFKQWKALSWWKRLRTKRPEPPTGI